MRERGALGRAATLGGPDLTLLGGVCGDVDEILGSDEVQGATMHS